MIYFAFLSGEYDQNQCPQGQTCEPCPDRLPSCVGLPDGDQPAAGHRWTDLYVRCYKNRTTEVKHCPNGAVFDPNRLACVSKIKSGMIALLIVQLGEITLYKLFNCYYFKLDKIRNPALSRAILSGKLQN